MNTNGRQVVIEQIKGGMRLNDLSMGTREDYPGLRSKKAVLEELGGEWSEKIIPEPDRYVAFTVRQMLAGIRKAVGADDYSVYLTRGGSFRKGIYPEYKANRENVPKPVHAATIEEYLLDKHGASISHEIEADDAMAMRQSQALLTGSERTIICSLDKDLLMIPGWHYNWANNKLLHVSPEEGMHNFWVQTLTGDATDNIPGLPGIGKKKAEAILQDVPPGEEKAAVLAQYEQHGFTEQELVRNCQLLWMLRKPLEDTYGKSYEEFMLGDGSAVATLATPAEGSQLELPL